MKKVNVLDKELEALMKEHNALMKDLRTQIKKDQKNNQSIPIEEIINVIDEIFDKACVLNKLDTKFVEYLFQLVKKMIKEK